MNGAKIIENVMKLHDATKNALVKKKCIEIMPLLYKYILQHFNDSNLDHVMRSLISFVMKKENKDRGSGFISIGKISLLVKK